MTRRLAIVRAAAAPHWLAVSRPRAEHAHHWRTQQHSLAWIWIYSRASGIGPDDGRVVQGCFRRRLSRASCCRGVSRTRQLVAKPPRPLTHAGAACSVFSGRSRVRRRRHSRRAAANERVRPTCHLSTSFAAASPAPAAAAASLAHANSSPTPRPLTHAGAADAHGCGVAVTVPPPRRGRRRR